MVFWLIGKKDSMKCALGRDTVCIKLKVYSRGQFSSSLSSPQSSSKSHLKQLLPKSYIYVVFFVVSVTISVFIPH